MMKVTWTLVAIERLESIHDFIAETSSDRADKVHERLLVAADQLKSHPLSGPVLPEDGAYRQLVVDGYRIVYRVSEDAVFVNTVIGPGMEYEHAI